VTTEMHRGAAAFAPTLSGVAARAGVSRSTASRVINGAPHVTPGVVRRVNEAIADLGYVPNRTARSLVRGRTQTIAMVIPERTAEFFADPYFAEVIQGAAMYASSTDYSLSLLIESEADPEKTFQFLRRGNVDGALVLSHHSTSSAYRDLARTLPVVFGVRPPGEWDDDLVVVDVDNVVAGALATRHLIERGRTRIATIAGPLTTVAGRDRLDGWRGALAEAGLDDDLVEEGDYTPSSGAEAARRHRGRGVAVDGLVVGSAQMASGALDVLRDAGLAVPTDVAVATIDDNAFSMNASPTLTTVDLHTSEKGAAMVAALLGLVAEGVVRTRTRIPVDLIVRASS
jgi:DNA-binding LacI/PurR family transcriptional regulator